MPKVRLQKMIAQCGLGSRRTAERWIREGRVRVNGQTVTKMGVRVDPDVDEIVVDGRRLVFDRRKTYIILNKPRFCITTLNDPQHRPSVAQLVSGLDVRVFPVGRLDWDAEGLLLLTNDGFLAHRLSHPRFGVKKTYHVKVKGHPNNAVLNRLRTGVVLDEGKTAPAEVEILRKLKESTWLEITLHQGWYRQIKRMGDKVGHPVLKIKRVAYGPLRLGKLAPGTMRHLTDSEVASLYRDSCGNQR